MARDLVSLIVAAVGESQLDPAPAPQASRCRQILRKSEEYAADCEASRLRIPNICKVVGVSERSLRYSFQKLLDISPASYLKAQRLNRARQALRISDPSETMVKQIAYAHGFWHLGQFACDYKRYFGESPSETLAGSPSRKNRPHDPPTRPGAS